jgi:DNA ligase-1
MRILEFAQTFAELEKISSRNEITRVLADLLRRASADEASKICYLALGELAPAYRGIDFNIAEKMLIKIIASVYGKTTEQVLALYKHRGDLGDAAYELSFARARRFEDEKLSVTEVYNVLMKAAQESGQGSQERKIVLLADLVKKLDALSAKFIIRIPAGKLRLGFSDATILDALSVMARGDKSARSAIERAYNVSADIGEIARLFKYSGLEALENIQPKPGIPIRPSLAERMPDPVEVIKKLGPKVAVEPKLDGLRTALHIWNEGGKKQVRLFSRNLENTTLMFPEITDSAKKLNVLSVILDGEAIGYDSAKGKFARFQETSRRKRKHGIEKASEQVPLAFFAFDVLYLDGRSLLDQPFSRRREILEKLLPRVFGAIRRNELIIAQHPEVITKELNRTIRLGLEGLVIKNLASSYEAGSRGFHWIKIKPLSAALEDIREGRLNKSGGLVDTIDCVLMGAYKGKGKRAEFGFGGFLLGVRGKDGKFYTISRLGTGISEAWLKEMAALIKKPHTRAYGTARSQLAVSEKPAEYVAEKEVEPDIWAKPKLVVEILADEITLSPRHTAGPAPEPAARYGVNPAPEQVRYGASRKKNRGYSLRFPRLVRFREDKKPEDATTVDEIAKMYRMQKR